jgi:hypothetical protein
MTKSPFSVLDTRYPFCAFHFFHRARCAAAILARAAADKTRLRPEARPVPPPVRAAIALSSRSRSVFNWATTCERFMRAL